VERKERGKGERREKGEEMADMWILPSHGIHAS
jgi:hypothetical protein